MHCNKNPIYLFPEEELRGLSPNFHIHVSVIDLYIARIDPHIFLQQKRLEYINRSQTRECAEIWTEAAQFLFWEYLF